MTIKVRADLLADITALINTNGTRAITGAILHQQLTDMVDSTLMTGDLPASLLDEIKQVDGAGSGLDADLLDGVNGAAYLARANHTGTQTLATISDAAAALALKAPLASPSLTGTPTAPTAAPGTSTTQIATTAFTAAIIATRRLPLTADTTLYVRTDGSDSHDGSANDAAHAFLTPQGASDYIADNLDLRGFKVTVQCAAGDYSKSAYCLRKVGPYHGGNPKGTTFPSASVAPVVFRGDPTSAVTAANYILHSTTTDAVLADASAYFAIEGFDVASAAGSCFHTGTCASILLGSNIYGASTDAKIFAGHSSVIECYANGWLRDNSPAIMGIGFDGSIFFSGTTLTLLGNITVSVAFAQINSGELCYAGMTFTPGAFALTGMRFTIEGGGQIRTFSDDITYLPGSIEGIIYAGYYDRMGPEIYGFAANKNAVDQTYSSATLTKVTFTNELRDTPAVASPGFYDAPNSKLFTTAGRYTITLLLQSKGTTDAKKFIALIYKNGAVVAQTLVISAATGPVSAFVTYTDDCVVGDYFEAYAYDDSTGTRTIDGTVSYTRFSGQRH